MSSKAAIERFIVDELLFGDTRTTIGSDESLLSSGVLDSLALLRLILFIEEQFGIAVEDGEVIPENFDTLDRIEAFLEGKRRVSSSGDRGSIRPE